LYNISLLGLGRIIDEFTSKVNDQANSIRITLKACSEENDKLTGKITSSDMRIRRTQQAKQAKRFIELMKKYQDMQNLYKSKYRAQLERQYLIVKPMATREELDRVVGADGANVLTQQMLFSMANKALAQTQLTEMKERHHEIVTIEKSIQEIHEMFMDMALIVDQQGELIDRLGEHVENTLEYTQKGASQVEAAVASKRRSQRIKWILSIIGLVLLIIIGVTLWIELGGSKSGSSPPQQQPPPPQQLPPPPQQQPPPPQQQPPPPQQQQQKLPLNQKPQSQPPPGPPQGHTQQPPNHR
jgi:t-SNARE complex subunit (syntaxin)